MAEFTLPPFDCAPGLRLSAHERVIAIQIEALERRQKQLEQFLERLERRVWLTVYGVAAMILAQAFQSMISAP